MLEIKPVNTTLYVVSSDELENRIDKILTDISSIPLDDHSTEISESLEDALVSRLISTRFVKENPNYFNNNNLFIKIITPFKGRSIEVTVGSILFNGKEKIVNGVLYK